MIKVIDFICNIKGHVGCNISGMTKGKCIKDPKCYDNAARSNHCAYCGKELGEW